MVVPGRYRCQDSSWSIPSNGGHVTPCFVERFVDTVVVNPVGVITTRMRNMKVAEVLKPAA